ncbi:MAG TPA: hypothetical protein VN914_18020 [Polyangia bacterium]|nr:hypothetical protein [Polyangia bacterium]
MAQEAMQISSTAAELAPRLRWSWLWAKKTDLLWNLVPFWAGFLLLGLIYAFPAQTGDTHKMWTVDLAGRSVSLMAVILFLYGPLVDAPHLWATIARTYTDREEWTQRRRLFLISLLAFAIGPAIVLLPYAIGAILPLPAGGEKLGWAVWSWAFSFYALFHINRQHWGFVALYNRKSGDTANKVETRADSLFFQTAIWLPYVAMLTAPWYLDFDGKPFRLMQLALGPTTVGAVLHTACNIGFFVVCAAYAAFQIGQWRKGHARNGSKLVYEATVLGLYFLTFAVDPRLATFWVIVTGTGHCAQYHAVVWAYGKKRYAGDKQNLPTKIFGNIWLYIALGVLFGLVTLQGPGAGVFQRLVGRAFGAISPGAGFDIGIKVALAFIAGVRLHHFYVDSKIWKVSKSAALAKNLNVEMPAPPRVPV